jgi:hypothetical protein
MFANSLPITIKIKEALSSDALGQSVVQALQGNHQQHPKISLSECNYENGLLKINELVYFPVSEELRVEIMKRAHDNPAIGHPGVGNTYEQVIRKYWWTGMRRMIKRYVKNCNTCRRINPVCHLLYRYLRPLQVPERRWQHISMDFITGLTRSGDHDSILVVVCRLSKMAHFLPTTMDGCDAPEVVRLFRDYIFRLHRFPETSVSDRGSVFVSEFFRAFARLTKLQLRYSISFHPQMDRQTERVNAILEQYIRRYCLYQQDNWNELLARAEFAYNNSMLSSTRLTPFFANYGYNPCFILELRPENPKTPHPEIQNIGEQLSKIEAYLKAEMTYAKAKQAEFADPN